MADIYDTSFRRLRKVRNKNIDTDNKINVQEKTDEKNKEHIQRFNPSQNEFITLDIKDFEWTLSNLEGSVDTQYLSWEVIIPRFDIRYLPYITVDFSYRIATENDPNQNPYPIKFSHKGIYYSVSDIEGIDEKRQEHIKKVTVHASLYFFSLIVWETPTTNTSEGILNHFELLPIISVPKLAIFT